MSWFNSPLWEEDPVDFSSYPIWAEWDKRYKSHYTLYRYIGWEESLKLYVFQERGSRKASIGFPPTELQRQIAAETFKPFLIDFVQLFGDDKGGST
jgi:hypothetical protein